MDRRRRWSMAPMPPRPPACACRTATWKTSADGNLPIVDGAYVSRRRPRHAKILTSPRSPRCSFASTTTRSIGCRHSIRTGPATSSIRRRARSSAPRSRTSPTPSSCRICRDRAPSRPIKATIPASIRASPRNSPPPPIASAIPSSPARRPRTTITAMQLASQSLADAFFDTPADVQANGGVDALLRGILSDETQANDVYAVDELRNLLAASPDQMDLIAIDIQRERDLGHRHAQPDPRGARSGAIYRISVRSPAIPRWRRICSRSSAASTMSICSSAVWPRTTLPVRWSARHSRRSSRNSSRTFAMAIVCGGRTRASIRPQSTRSQNTTLGDIISATPTPASSRRTLRGSRPAWQRRRRRGRPDCAATGDRRRYRACGDRRRAGGRYHRRRDWETIRR